MVTLLINKYRVMLFESGNPELVRSSVTIAASEIEAIEKVRQSTWWYDEGVGANSKKLTYPLAFKAEIKND